MLERLSRSSARAESRGGNAVGGADDEGDHALAVAAPALEPAREGLAAERAAVDLQRHHARAGRQRALERRGISHLDLVAAHVAPDAPR